jgi:hypothetical protein
MTEETTVHPADKLVKVYIKIRDAKAALVREHDTAVAGLDAQLNMIQDELLTICKSTGQDGGKTSHGTFTRTVKTRYDTTDWSSMHAFIKEHDALDLLERRVSQLNMKSFLTENPDLLPAGLNVMSRYAITVRRPTK